MKPLWGSKGAVGKADEDEEESKGKTPVVGNRILFYQQVDQSSMLDLILKLRETEEELLAAAIAYEIEPPPIHLHINSYGGEVFAALGAMDHILACRVPVWTYVDGGAASAATMLSVVGHKRFIYPNGYMLIHQISSAFWGKHEEWKDEAKNLDKLMEQMRGLYRKHGRVPETDLLEILKHDLWLDAEKCLAWGLVDEIKRPPPKGASIA